VKFLLDADLPPRLCLLFAAAGHDAIHVGDTPFASASDGMIANHARELGRCVVTGDFDYSDIREFEPRRFAGIIILTIPRNAKLAYIELITRELLERLPQLEPLRGKLVIVEAGRIRVRD
jgi:predicted nuclease of predicted toxin-antitoxin system